MKIVETDNFNGDYPNERFVNLPSMSEEHAKRVAEAINDGCSTLDGPRFWKVEADDYVLQPGLEP